MCIVYWCYSSCQQYLWMRSIKMSVYHNTEWLMWMFVQFIELLKSAGSRTVTDQVKMSMQVTDRFRANVHVKLSLSKRFHYILISEEEHKVFSSFTTLLCLFATLTCSYYPLGQSKEHTYFQIKSTGAPSPTTPVYSRFRNQISRKINALVKLW